MIIMSISKKRVPMCPEEWNETFGEEFYSYSMGNLYYDPQNEEWQANTECKPVDDQLPFEIKTDKEIINGFETLKVKGAICNG